MRLDEGTILRSPQIMNPLGERELDLRGNGLTLLDEGPLLQLDDSFDVMDLTDNSLTSLEYIPEMKRLTTLIAHRNKLQRVSLSAALRLPHLHSFVADDNNFSSLDQLVVFGKFPLLERISLGGSNPVARHEHFRSFLMYLCPKLKLINFQRVLAVERAAVSILRSTFEAVVQNSAGAAALSMNVQKELRQRKRGRNAVMPQSAPGGVQAESDDHAVSSGPNDTQLDDKITKLQERIDAAETEEEMSALMEEMEALQDAMERNRARRK
ncbi:U2 small nuclear ribonucleoprotein 40K, putative [Bodo saltans]|uniref:U2 small nuclear ribonucleoprotein 40K, putative n=1 Tax=Bodo saltans TaxID=75058 RepID=A0A0S4IPQ0_BODSA|nr:U2 small nuclear ribonucleoprotein 40K, putative [Bodo saltans]|eukprot:CUF01503.1 U2 small nuclear ribonucleoprotein 40K, putative [Bodo saltans]